MYCRCSALLALFQFGKGLASRTLFIFSGTMVVLLAVAILFGGKPAMRCIVGVGLFTSIGWPNIFSLALDQMGVYKSQVSSLLVMTVVGGAILPAILGRVADVWNLQASFIVPLAAYAYVAFYGWKGHEDRTPQPGNLKNLTWPPGFAHVHPGWQNAHTWPRPGRGSAHAVSRKCAGCR